MSDGSERAPYKIHEHPLENIGAQDLIKVDYLISGYLHKQSKVRRFLGFKKWALKYIVVSQGCVYCYNNDSSQSPISAFSLCVYEKVLETNAYSVPHTFEIHPEDTSKSPHVFACDTDEKRKEWVDKLNDVIRQCRMFLNKLSNDSGIGEEGGFTMQRKSRKNLPPLPNLPGQSTSATGVPKKYKEAKSEYDLESEEEEEPYDDPVEQAPPLPRTGVPVLPVPSAYELDKRKTISERPALPIPPIPKQQAKAQTLPQTHARTQAPTSPRSSYVNNSVFTEEEYLFDSSDRTGAVGMISTEPEGTFLVRRARSGPGSVLTVLTPIGIKEFKVTEKDGKVSLDDDKWFPAIAALVTYYNQNNIPKADYQVKLVRGYKSLT